MEIVEDADGETVLVNAVDGLGTALGTTPDGVEIEKMAELAGEGNGTTELVGNGDRELGTLLEVGAREG